MKFLNIITGKRTSTIAGMAAAALVMLLTASCSDSVDDTVAPANDRSTDVLVSIAPQPTLSDFSLAMGGRTRAVETSASEDGEKMKSWFVVVAKGRTIERILTSRTISGETDRDSTYTHLSNGLTTFYSFANLEPSDIGLDNAKAGGELPDDFETQALSINGNQTAATDFANGIPMSNKEQFTITPATNRIDLTTIRMVAKLRVSVTNTTDSAMTIRALSLSDVTRNTASNVGILPGTIKEESTGERTPNIDSTVAKGTQTWNFDNGVVVAAGAKHDFSVYMNESLADSDPGYFVLTITTARNDGDSTGTRRYSFLQWNSIARNELRIVPVTLSDYQIQFEVRPFTAIGVLPRVDNSRTDVASIIFGLYGHYDLVPSVMKLSTNEHVDNLTNVSYTFNSNVVGGSSDFITGIGWNPTAQPPRIECIVGNRTGWVLYDITASFTINGRAVNVTRRFRLSNTYVDIDQLAKKHHSY